MGITNQRETTMAWDSRTGAPIDLLPRANVLTAHLITALLRVFPGGYCSLETLPIEDPCLQLCAGQPLHNAIVWMDRRTSAICQRLTKELGSGVSMQPSHLTLGRSMYARGAPVWPHGRCASAALFGAMRLMCLPIMQA